MRVARLLAERGGPDVPYAVPRFRDRDVVAALVPAPTARAAVDSSVLLGRLGGTGRPAVTVRIAMQGVGVVGQAEGRDRDS